MVVEVAEILGAQKLVVEGKLLISQQSENLKRQHEPFGPGMNSAFESARMLIQGMQPWFYSNSVLGSVWATRSRVSICSLVAGKWDGG